MTDSDLEEYENSHDALETFEEEGMGTGVKTNRKLPKNTLLGEYKGTILTYPEAMEKMKENRMHYIVKAHKENTYIDGEGQEGNILRYINHKCLFSNCELVKLSRSKVGIITKRIVLANEPLNYDYNLTYFDGVTKATIKCNCHADCPNFL
jgi:SET domain